MAKMTPILYEKDESNFETLGIGKLTDAISCNVIEERNGQYEMTMVYPVGGALYEELTVDRIICCYAHKYDREPELFRIYFTASTTSTNSMTVNARQLALHRMDYSVVLPLSLTGTAAAAMAKIKTKFVPTGNSGEYPYTFSSDVTGTKDYKLDVPCSLYDAIFNEETGLLALYGGELSYHRHAVTLSAARGEESRQIIKYGRNMVSMDQTIDGSEVVTGVLPYWAKQDESGNTTIIYGSSYVSLISEPETIFQHIVPVDCTSNILKPEDMGDDWTPTADEVSAWGDLYLSTNYTGGFAMTISASVLEANDTDREIHLCDTVTLYHPGMGINLKAKVVGTDYNVLTDQWNSVSVGSVRSNLAQTLVDMTGTKHTIEKVTTGGGSTGTEGYWTWRTENGIAYINYDEPINAVGPDVRYGYYYALQRNLSLPARFSGWSIKYGTIINRFNNNNDEDERAIRTYTYNIDRANRTMTVRVLTTSADHLTGSINGTMTLVKDS